MQDSLVTVDIREVSQKGPLQSADRQYQAVDHAATESPAAAVAPASSAPFDPYAWLAASGLLVPSEAAVTAEGAGSMLHTVDQSVAVTTAARTAATMPSLDELEAAIPDGPRGSRWTCNLCSTGHISKLSSLVRSFAVAGGMHLPACTYR